MDSLLSVLGIPSSTGKFWLETSQQPHAQYSTCGSCESGHIQYSRKKCCSGGIDFLGGLGESCNNNGSNCSQVQKSKCSGFSELVSAKASSKSQLGADPLKLKCVFSSQDFLKNEAELLRLDASKMGPSSKKAAAISDYCFKSASNGCITDKMGKPVKSCPKILTDGDTGRVCRKWAKNHKSIFDSKKNEFCSKSENADKPACACLSLGSSKNEYTNEYNEAKRLGVSMGSTQCWFRPCQPMPNPDKESALLSSGFSSMKGCPAPTCLNVSKVENSDLQNVYIGQATSCTETNSISSSTENEHTSVTTNPVNVHSTTSTTNFYLIIGIICSIFVAVIAILLIKKRTKK